MVQRDEHAGGKFNVDNTNDANAATMRATPNELIITTAINVTINCKSISTLATGATIIASMAG